MSTQPLTFRQHIAAVLTLGLPLVGGHLAQFAIGLTDTVMVGWYGVTELAALTLATSLFFVFFLAGAGFAWAVMPMVASYLAEDNPVMIRRTTRMGLWLSIIFCVLSLPFLYFADPILRALGQDPTVSLMAQDYLRIALWGLLPALTVMTLKSFLAALERAQVILWITVIAALFNAVANYALIFGNLGAPELGIKGAALASVSTHVITAVAVLFYISWVVPQYQLFKRFWNPDPEMFWKVFRLGWPIGLTNLSEVGLFVVSALMMGWLGTVPLAAHGIAIQLATATFMVHLGLSNAATVRAGNAFGRRDVERLTTGAKAVFLLSIAMSMITIVVFMTVPEPLIAIFLDSADPDRDVIIATGVALLAMAALFQFVDGAQVIALGLLRGVQDTEVPMWMAGLAYWGVGLPSSYLLGFTFGLGGVGIWLGLVLGLAVACVLLNWRFWRSSVPMVARLPAATLAERQA